jgi:hypothetical protein
MAEDSFLASTLLAVLGNTRTVKKSETIEGNRMLYSKPRNGSAVIRRSCTDDARSQIDTYMLIKAPEASLGYRDLMFAPAKEIKARKTAD